MTILDAIQILMTILLARYTIDLNPKLKSHIAVFDDSFKNIIDLYKQNDVIHLLQITKYFFGFLCILFLILTLLSAYIFGESKHTFLFYVTSIFLYSTVIWMSLKWFSDRVNMAKTLFVEYSKIIVYSLVLPVLDVMSDKNISITRMMLQAIYEPFNKIGFNLNATPESNIWLNGLIIFLFLEVILIIYIFFTTILFAPIALSAFGILFLTIKLANLLAYLSPRKPLSPLCFSILIISMIVDKLP